jgi:hypothetical protein
LQYRCAAQGRALQLVPNMSDVEIAGRDAKNGQFIKGYKGGGRPAGARSKLGEQFVADLRDCWEKHGIQALERCALEEPSQFVRVIAGLMPRDLNLNIALDPTAFIETFRTACSLLGNPEPARLRRSLRKQPPVIEHDD